MIITDLSAWFRPVTHHNHGGRMTLRERLLKEADRLRDEYGKGYATAQSLLREAAAALAAPREPDGWALLGHVEDGLYALISIHPDRASAEAAITPTWAAAGTKVCPFTSIGAPAPAETREQEVDNA